MSELDIWAAIRGLKQQLDRLTSFEWPLYATGTWTPTWTGLTVVGAPIYSGSYTRIGRLIFWSVIITAGGANTTASTYGVTFVNNLPFTVARHHVAPVLDATNGIDLGSGYAGAGSTNFNTPTWSARNSTIMMNGVYEI